MPKRKRTNDDVNGPKPTGDGVTRRETRSSTRKEAPTSDATFRDGNITSTAKESMQQRKANIKTRPDTPTPAPIDTSDPNPPQAFSVSHDDKQIHCERRGPPGPPSLIFTHGAGGGLSNPATALFASGFSQISPIVSFQGTMNLKSRLASFQAVLDHTDPTSKIAVGGRSMGARAAVKLASRVPEKVAAVVLASYPLVGGKGDVRDEILLGLPGAVDVLFIIGERDEMCGLKMLREVVGRMEARCWLVVVEGADHGMGSRPKEGEEAVRRRVGSLAGRWLMEREGEKRWASLGWSRETAEVVVSEWQVEPLSTE